MDLKKQTMPSAAASYYLGMSEAWLRAGRANKDPDAPPYIRIGRSIRYFPEELDEWLAARPRHGKALSVSRAPPDLGQQQDEPPARQRVPATINASAAVIGTAAAKRGRGRPRKLVPIPAAE
jgi:predicted DNA-binding transcriptional regulator AlpA